MIRGQGPIVALTLAAGIVQAWAETDRGTAGEKVVPREKAVPHARRLCVTAGALTRDAANSQWMSRGSKVRAIVPGSPGRSIELRFKYLGPSQERSRLASGSIREQVGVKLLAADSCNVLYAMWRFGPKPGLVVSVKRNKGKITHDECGAGGYENLPSETGPAVGRPEVGRSYSLTARLERERLTVKLDGRIAWQGSIPAYLLRDLAGPGGFRADNASFLIESVATPDGTPRPDALPPPTTKCRNQG